jgi:hypothetical protein
MSDTPASLIALPFIGSHQTHLRIKFPQAYL